MNLEIQSVVHDGRMMTKKELLEYFLAIIKVYSEYEDVYKRREERASKISALQLDCNRRKIQSEYMAPLTGLAALSPRKRRAYKHWLEQAPQREKELQRKEAEETARVNSVKNCLKDMLKKQQEDNDYLARLINAMDMLYSQGVLPDEYKQPFHIKLIAKYLACNRANTLTEAINLYHQEMHWSRMEKMAQQQIVNTETANQRMEMQQREYMREMADMQRQHMKEVSQSINNVENAANEAKFYSEMNFWLNL